jgi:hypothetical protein
VVDLHSCVSRIVKTTLLLTNAQPKVTYVSSKLYDTDMHAWMVSISVTGLQVAG